MQGYCERENKTSLYTVVLHYSTRKELGIVFKLFTIEVNSS